MCIFVKWNQCFSDKVHIKCGTRQGGLTSPMLFNLFYSDLVRTIQSSKYGVNIRGKQFNCFCYADDLMICSLTVSGLQHLIDLCVSYVNANGLQFNPNKTACMILGKNPFVTKPTWNINGISLAINTNIKYLGTYLGDQNGATHCDNRIGASTRSYYSLQGVGIKYPGVKPKVSLNIFRSCINSVLTYGCSTIFCNKECVNKLDKLQSKLIKQCFRLRSYCHTTPLLKTINLLPVLLNIKLDSLDLLRNCILSDSITRDFYSHLLHLNNMKLCSSKTLVGRVYSFCVEKDIDFKKYLLNNNYMYKTKAHLKKSYFVKLGVDGLFDTLRSLMFNNNYDTWSNNMANLLLKAF